MIRKPPDKKFLFQLDLQYFEIFSKEPTYYGINSFYDGHRTLDTFTLPIELGRIPVQQNYLFLGNSGDFYDNFKITVRKVKNLENFFDLQPIQSFDDNWLMQKNKTHSQTPFSSFLFEYLFISTEKYWDENEYYSFESLVFQLMKKQKEKKLLSLKV